MLHSDQGRRGRDGNPRRVGAQGKEHVVAGRLLWRRLPTGSTSRMRAANVFGVRRFNTEGMTLMQDKRGAPVGLGVTWPTLEARSPCNCAPFADVCLASEPAQVHPCRFRQPSMAGGRRPRAATPLRHKYWGRSRGSPTRRQPLALAWIQPQNRPETHKRASGASRRCAGPHCAVVLVPCRRDQVYCSEACKKRAKRARAGADTRFRVVRSERPFFGRDRYPPGATAEERQRAIRDRQGPSRGIANRVNAFVSSTAQSRK
jgi:hypothetical protein